MATLNKRIPRPMSVNNEGTIVRTPTPLQSLRRTVMTTMLWEASYYENGVAIAERIKELIAKVTPNQVASLAIEAREEMKLRHTPLLMARIMAAMPSHKGVVRRLLAKIIQRPDELNEFLSIYWKDGKCAMSKQVQRGLADAFIKFDALGLAKYNNLEKPIKLRDVAFMTHVRPTPMGRSRRVPALNREDYKRGRVLRHPESPLGRLIDNNLPVPDNWEVAISACKNAAERDAEWRRLLDESKLGAMALIRNLRNLKQAGISDALVGRAIDGCNTERMLPFRFISAAHYAPSLEHKLEDAMYRCIAGIPKLPGTTALVIDTSPSMWEAKISEKSEMTRFDAAAALAILAREMCDNVNVYAFNEKAYCIPPRRGFSLRDALLVTKSSYSCGGLAVHQANRVGYDRIIVLTDGEWHYMNPDMNGIDLNSTTMGLAKDVSPPPVADRAYMLNVGNTQNGVGYGRWINIDGWSESVLNYIVELERGE